MTERSQTDDSTVTTGAHTEPPAAMERPPAAPEVPPAAVNGAHAELPPPPPAIPLADPTRIDTDAEDVQAGDDWWLHVPSWLASMVVHMMLVLLLALATIAQQGSGGLRDLLMSVDKSGPNGELEELESEMMQTAVELDEAPTTPSPDLTNTADLATLAGEINLVRPESLVGHTEIAPLGGENGQDAVAGNSPLSLRLDGAARHQILLAEGGTKESEEAVKKALYWLAEHQNYDGSWSFAHQKSPRCHGSCKDPGFTPGKIGATGLALLPFLGTGQTHREGAYKKNIDQGLKFLVRSMRIQGGLGSMYEEGGQMYGHGLAAIALCEAYGMTHDQALRESAQAAINFIGEAQDPRGGGWRYMPRQPGDTSVVGWQLMALKSGQMAYLEIPPGVYRKAGYFLDSVQSDRGAVYGYQTPERARPATTAIGLLCRMYLGWKHDQTALQQGVRILSTLGPSTDRSAMQNNMYYNYYATQVMHHYGGSEWRNWNKVMREYLIATQATSGHQTGSWFLDGMDHGAGAGGRLYCTAMAAMTLEVYYRYMPLYRPQSTDVAAGQK